MDSQRAEVLAWTEAQTGKTLTAADQADILRATGLQGAAARDLLQAFAGQFGVNMQACRADLHLGPPEVLSGPTWPIPAKTLRFPVSVTLLHSAAQAGHWPAMTPSLPRRSHWHRLNGPMALFGLPALTAALIALLF